MIRRGAPSKEESSSSEDEDAFSALATKNKEDKQVDHVAKALPIVPATTSSMKRHHVQMSNTRKAKMDAILQDLEIETDHASRKPLAPPKGSFVKPGEELVTTNIFLSNLCPSVSDDHVKDLFSQFGPLHSFKIMWPRTSEERSRNRNTGFVSFVHRADADAAMDACSDKDPFQVGRRLMMRWGKHVKATEQPMDTFSENRQRLDDEAQYDIWETDPSVRVEGDRLKATTPMDQNSLSYRNDSANIDSDEISRTNQQQQQQQQREIMTGRQLERTEGRNKLRPDDERLFQTLVRTKLTASRQAICEATAFCFEQSGAAESIANLLKDVLMESNCSIDTRVARLYLLSDLLFNSQQPSIRNAFRYRDAVERMSPDIFASLGRHGDHSNLGRMRLNKLKTAVSGVLSAWTNWSVFDYTFIDELEARFEGREVVTKTEVMEIPAEEIVKESNEEPAFIVERPKGLFTEVTDEQDEAMVAPTRSQKIAPINYDGSKSKEKHVHVTKGEVSNGADDEIDGETLGDDEVDDETLRLLDEDYFVYPDDKGTDCNFSEIGGELISANKLEGEMLESEEIR